MVTIEENTTASELKEGLNGQWGYDYVNGVHYCGTWCWSRTEESASTMPNGYIKVTDSYYVGELV